MLSWLPSCGACEQCLRDLPHLCAAAWEAMDAGGLLDGTTRLSRDGEPVFHYSLLSAFAERAVVPAALLRPDPGGRPVGRRRDRGLRGDHGHRRGVAHRGRAARASAWRCSAAAASG